MSITLKKIGIMIAVLGLGTSLFAGAVVTFLKDGRLFNGTIIDMSSNTGIMDYKDGTKVNRNEVWMISYESGEWDFPDERDELSGTTDTIFLKNGEVITGHVVDFSSRRFIWELKDGTEVNEAEISRIYFCCDILPAAYGEEEEEDEE